MSSSRSRWARRGALAALILGSLALPAAAQATTFTILVKGDGTFSYNGGPPSITVRNGDTVRWTGLGKSDSIVQIGFPSSVVTPDPAKVCFDASLAAPDYRYSYVKPFDGNNLNEFTGPPRRGFSGLWALAPEGGETSYIEQPSTEADAIFPGGTSCGQLDHYSASPFTVPDPANPGGSKLVKYYYTYELASFHTSTSSNATIAGEEIDRLSPPAAPVKHRLCVASAHECDLAGLNCGPKTTPDPAYPGTIPDGTYMNGVLEATYNNPEVTGVVLRFNWKDLQYESGGVVQYRWTHLDREIERAIKHGKYVTLDVRAGMFGTPAWIFNDYPRALTSAPPGARQVVPLSFVDHYDEDPAHGCGDPVKIGSPGDINYRLVYKSFLEGLGDHIASDARWFAAVAHVKVSGANMRTSEAELPHHCDDQYTATGDHVSGPKSILHKGADRVLDVYKYDTGTRETDECTCNTKVWFDAGYEPSQLYDYYAEVENQLALSFFNRKSLGYQIIQDGFPRADVNNSFLGDHMYKEVLVPSSTDGVLVNIGSENGEICEVPPYFDSGYFCDDPSACLCDGQLRYCSEDAVSPYGKSCWIRATPIAGNGGYGYAPYPGPVDDGSRYPGAFDQSMEVLAEADAGRFGAPTITGYTNLPLGKLFVPQHSGLQPLPNERYDVGYGDAVNETCDQQLAAQTPTGAIAAGYDLGSKVAKFPILPGTAVSTLSDTAGCPNHWIVDEGIQDTAPNAPPPQLTGFQNTNVVRTLDAFESSLFNLVYNTNAVFLEVYEDVLWRAALTKGTSADPVAAQPLSTRPAGGYCQYTNGGVASDELCYSKTLHQWSEELHYRRALAEAGVNTTVYAAFKSPFPGEHAFTFHSNALPAKVFYFINPSRCDSAKVDVTGAASTNALGKITLLP